jgi:hypothetical protein
MIGVLPKRRVLAENNSRLESRGVYRRCGRWYSKEDFGTSSWQHLDQVTQLGMQVEEAGVMSFHGTIQTNWNIRFVAAIGNIADSTRPSSNQRS